MLPRTKIVIACIVILIALIVADQWRKRSVDDRDMSSTTTPQGSTATPVEAAADEWKEFVPQTNKFKVMLPALPQHAAEAVPLPAGQGMIKYDMYLSQEKDGTTYMISLIQYPDAFNTSNPSELLDGVMKEMMSGSSNNKLISSKKENYQGFDALDFAIQNSDWSIRCITFLAGKTLFVLTLIDRTPEGIDEAFKKFINSFKLDQSYTMDQMQQMPVPANQ